MREKYLWKNLGVKDGKGICLKGPYFWELMVIYMYICNKHTCSKPSLGESLGTRLYILSPHAACLNYQTKLDYIWEWLRLFLANHR